MRYILFQNTFIFKHCLRAFKQNRSFIIVISTNTILIFLTFIIASFKAINFKSKSKFNENSTSIKLTITNFNLSAEISDFCLRYIFVLVKSQNYDLKQFGALKKDTLRDVKLFFSFLQLDFLFQVMVKSSGVSHK